MAPQEIIVNFIVLNGSPKGEVSVTIQYIKYLQKKFKNHSFEIINISKEIKAIKNLNENRLEKIIEKMNHADGIIWAYPVYHFVVPAQYQQFIELLYQHKDQLHIDGKYACAISTSIHFFDHLAENYIRDISTDLGLRYVRGFLAEMNDLMKKNKQDDLVSFFERFNHHIEQKWEVENLTTAIENNPVLDFDINPDQIKSIDSSNKFLLITDANQENNNLFKMIEYCQRTLGNNLKIINLSQLKIKSGCLGCLRCGYQGDCAINDDLRIVIKKELLEADGIIIAANIKMRYISSLLKTFWDRSFLHGHRPINKNKNFLYLCSGPFLQTPLIRQEIEARINVFGGNLLGIIHDDTVETELLSKQMNSALKNMVYSTSKKIKSPRNFLGHAGHKIFRDFIYLSRPVFMEDHSYFKKIKYYDFPQKKWAWRALMPILILLIKLKPIRREFYNKMKEGMIVRLKKVVEKA